MINEKNFFRRNWPFVLVLVLLLVTVFSYAYWDSLQVTDTPDNIIIGKGVTLSINKNVTASGTLVPEGAILKDGDVTEVVYVYTVSLDNQAAEDLDLTVTCTEKKIDDNAELDDLFNVNIALSADKVNADSPVTVTVTVTLKAADEISEDQYNLINNKGLSFTLNFTAAKAE
jgi:hypothetical protein